MHYLLVLILAAQAAARYITVPIERPLLQQVTTEIHSFARVTSDVVTATTSSLPSMTFSALVTIAPLSRNPLELRQRCFNDQGFSVNCATWTGYYYTWGGAGHPYEGGPGEGSGSGSSNRNSATTSIVGSENRFENLKMSLSVAMLTICLLLLL